MSALTESSKLYELTPTGEKAYNDELMAAEAMPCRREGGGE